MRAAVYVGTEGHAVVVDFHQRVSGFVAWLSVFPREDTSHFAYAVFLGGSQGEGLKSPTVGHDRAMPIHHRMQSAHGPDRFGSRAKIEVVGVGQQTLDSDLGELQRSEGLHRGPGSDG